MKITLVRSNHSCDETMYLYRLENGKLVLVTSYFDVWSKTWSWEVYVSETAEVETFVLGDEGEGLLYEVFKAHLVRMGRG